MDNGLLTPLTETSDARASASFSSLFDNIDHFAEVGLEGVDAETQAGVEGVETRVQVQAPTA